jgi:hypothetical protein
VCSLIAVALLVFVFVVMSEKRKGKQNAPHSPDTNRSDRRGGKKQKTASPFSSVLRKQQQAKTVIVIPFTNTVAKKLKKNKYKVGTSTTKTKEKSLATAAIFGVHAGSTIAADSGCDACTGAAQFL